MREVRGNDISMIFQEPMTCLNPVFRIGDQRGADRLNNAEASRRAQQLLLADARYREPFYWAPFLPIGNWL